MTKSQAAALAAAVLLAVPARAQAPAPPTTQTAAPRPPKPARETASAQIAGGKVAIDYGRPSLHGRQIGELLGQLPADRIWRAGIDQVTTLTTANDVMIGGTKVPAGKYSVYLHLPATGNASLVLNTDPGIPLKQIYAAAPPETANALWPRLDGYEKIAKTEVARIALASVKPVEAMDRFLIAFEPAKDGVSALTFTWGDQAWTTGVKAVK